MSDDVADAAARAAQRRGLQTFRESGQQRVERRLRLLRRKAELRRKIAEALAALRALDNFIEIEHDHPSDRPPARGAALCQRALHPDILAYLSGSRL